MNDRREFLSRFGALSAMTALPGLAATTAVDADELTAAPAPDTKWDTSWLDALASAQHRVVFNADDIAEGAAMAYAEIFLNHFHEVHGTIDAQTRPVIIFRRLGTPMVLDDALWDRYAVGADVKIQDSRTNAPARRNVYKKEVETLRGRGLISLVCNIALGNWSARAAKRSGRTREEVLSDARANLIPGTIIVPSGIYALIRAQNAGCAFMPGT